MWKTIIWSKPFRFWKRRTVVTAWPDQLGLSYMEETRLVGGGDRCHLQETWPWSSKTGCLAENEAFGACSVTIKFLTINNGNFGLNWGLSTFLAPEIQLVYLSEAAGPGFFCTWGNIPPSLFNTSESSILRWHFDKSHRVNCPRTLGMPR